MKVEAEPIDTAPNGAHTDDLPSLNNQILEDETKPATDPGVRDQPAQPPVQPVMVDIIIEIEFKDGSRKQLKQPLAVAHLKEVSSFISMTVMDIRKVGGVIVPTDDNSGIRWVPLEGIKEVQITAKKVGASSIVTDTNVKAADILARARAAADKGMRTGAPAGVTEFPRKR